MGLYGPDGTLQRYVRAGQALHKAVEKMRGPTDAEIEAVARAILREAREEGADSPVDAGDAQQLARAAIIALDEVRGR